MPRKLPRPIATPDETAITLDAWSFTVVRRPDLTANPGQTQLDAMVTFRTDAAPTRQVAFSRSLAQLLARDGVLAAAVRDLHEALLAELQAEGTIPAGSDSPDV